MTDFSHLQAALSAEFQGRVMDIQIRRGNELHLRLARGAALPLAQFLRQQFHAEPIFLAANDRLADTGKIEVHYLFANGPENWFVHASKELPADDLTITSLGTFAYAFSRYEREIKDMFGITALGQPDTRPLVRHGFWPESYRPLRKDAQPPADFHDDGTRFPFLPVGGEGVYEIPVGPVHAGIIEPGHFRFSVVGETVIDLKIRLYFTHKGTEKLFEGRLPAAGVELAERISGDTTIGHSLAYCQAVESLAGCTVPSRARYLRTILLEMERLYNHIADFGAIGNDTGFGFAQSQTMRIRERLLRLNKRLTGNRLLRGGVVLGGVGHDLPADLDLAAEVQSVLADFNEVVEISLDNTMLMDRLEGAGWLDNEIARGYGVTGYVARASNIDADARRDHPFAAYADLHFPVSVHKSGDVYARTMVRVEEVRTAVDIITQALAALPAGPLTAPVGSLPAWQPAFSIVEAWRGALIHWVMADAEGRLYRVKVRDPSFVNWPALSMALLKNIVPDFPLCNKSFNQSYSGNDL